MEEKLELNQLKRYLGTNLEVKMKAFPKPVMMTGLETETPSTQERIIFKDAIGDFYKGYLYECKPLIHPLDRLTEPILEGDKIPLEEICLNFTDEVDFIGDGVAFWKINTLGAGCIDCSYTIDTCFSEDGDIYIISEHFKRNSTEEQNLIHYLRFQQLLEWHFDVFGLIEKGLALPIDQTPEP